MPFGLQREPGLWRLLREWRENPALGYLSALGFVIAAAFFRWMLDRFLVGGVPFITFYGAVICATFVGGIGPGVLAVLLSAVLARLAFMFPHWSIVPNQIQLASTLVFCAVASIQVILVSALNRALDRLASVSANTRVLLDHAPIGIAVSDEDGTIAYCNDELGRQFGYRARALVGRKVETLVPEDHRESHVTFREGFQLSPVSRAMGRGSSLTGRRFDGSEFPIEVGLNPIQRDHRMMFLATVVDISDRRAMEERQHLLTRELHHRVQNLLAVVQSVASRTLSSPRSADEAKQVLMGRIRALSYAFRSLRDGNLAAGLREIIEAELAGFSDRVTLTCSEIDLLPEVAQDFALIVHELATNATKYGALSSPRGHVKVKCLILEQRRVEFTWEESGGPSVLEPEETGFGTVLLEAIPKRFASIVEIFYDPRGLNYHLVADLERVAETPHS